MEALICKQCGAAINPRTMMCEYCGTKYRDEPTFSVLHIERPGGITLETKTIIPDIQLYIGHIDRCLNEDAYICPGLGDAGDRIFGTNHKQDIYKE